MTKNMTPKKRRAVEALLTCPNITAAALKAGVSRETMYPCHDWRSGDAMKKRSRILKSAARSYTNKERRKNIMWLADWCALIGEFVTIAIGIFAVASDQWGLLVGAGILFIAIAVLWAEWRADK